MDSLVKDCILETEKANNLHDCDLLKNKFLGKNSAIKKELQNLRNLPLEERKIIAAKLQQIQEQIQKNIEEKIEQLKNKVVKIDSSLPVYDGYGYYHPIPMVIKKIKSLLITMNMTFEESPEIETEWNNFSAVNVPENHPCREDHQSFFLKNGKMLRTHTSSIQSYLIKKYMDNREYKVFTVGRTYRRDLDSTHVPMFHQIEGFVVSDKKSSIKHMLNFIQTFLNSFFEKTMEIRIRPSFFPFTEPSLEIDVLFNGKWLEILGCGMIHPNVFQLSNSPKKQGFAFGCGLERLTMLKYNIRDLRLFYNQDYRTIQSLNFRSC